MSSHIYDFIEKEEIAFRQHGVMVTETWEWRMYQHIKRSTLYKNSQFEEGKIGDKPFKNIIRPILNVAYRSEGFDVKDITPFVNDEDDYYLSFLVKKFHDKWARKNDLDTFIDDTVEAYVDYGGVLVKNVNDIRPEVVQWQQVAFCDQANILSGTIALKHTYTISELKDTVKDMGWYADPIDLVILNAKKEKKSTQSPEKKSISPQKNIDVYEIHGSFPEDWLAKDGDNYSDYNAKLDADKYSNQIHIVSFVDSDSESKNGVCLFKGPEKKSIFKLLIRDKIYGRGLGFGGIEELFEPQIWTNFSEIHMMDMLKQASKIIYQTADAGFTTRNNTRNAKNGDVFVYEEGKPATLMNNQALNLPIFERAVASWESHARTTGSANDAQLGIAPSSGTPFALQSLVTSTGQGIHEFRRGKIATFMGEIYRDWILQYLVDDMNKGDKWIDELSLEEMQDMAQKTMECAFDDYTKQVILKNGGLINGQVMTEELLAPMKQKFIADFSKSKRKFIQIIKDKFKEIPIEVDVNIAGKQKDLGKIAEKLTDIFRTIFSNPQGFMATMAIPGAAKSFNEMLESSGLNQMDFSRMPAQPVLGQDVQQNNQVTK